MRKRDKERKHEGWKKVDIYEAENKDVGADGNATEFKQENKKEST